MELLYFQAEDGNFGDDMNQWFWDAMLPGWQDMAPDVTLFGIGTLIKHSLLEDFRGRRLLTLGTGVGYGAPPEMPLQPEWDFRILRGPASARALGLPPERGLIDPAMMLPRLPAFAGLSERPRDPRPVMVPHHESIARHDWAGACARAGVSFVDPRDEARSVIHRIATAPRVLAESLHAAIIADAFRVPWVPLWVSFEFNFAKWQDVFETLAPGEAPRPLFGRLGQLPFGQRLSRRGRLRRRLERGQLPGRLRAAVAGPALLSPADSFRALQSRYLATLQEVRQAYSGVP